MFGSSKRKVKLPDATKIDTVVGKDTFFHGIIESQGSVRIDGRLEGRITVHGNVLVGECGQVQADIQAQTVEIAGEVRGNVTAVDRVVLMAAARLYGDIKAERLAVSEGAVFKGACEMTNSPDSIKTKGDVTVVLPATEDGHP